MSGAIQFGDGRLPSRFWQRAVIDARDCWRWAGSLDWSGYGQYWHEGATRGAHRICYLILIGPIPEGFQVDHLCRVRDCVNPAHLEAVTPQVNTLRGNTLPAINAGKTHCPAGHPYDSVNTRTVGGRRFCRPCEAPKSARFRQRHKGRVA